MNPTFAVYCFGHDLEAIRYPYVASIASALALTEKLNGRGAVYFAVCDCTDETEARVRAAFAVEIEQGELVLSHHPWRDHHHIQVEVCNALLDQIGEKFRYLLKLDTDEVLHEDSFDDFQEDLIGMAHAGTTLARPHYTHLLDDQRDFDFIYRSKAVISRASAGLRYADNDACALGGAPEAQTSLEVFHYGKWNPGREREALLKEVTFTKGYADLGFPDPRVIAQLEQGYLDYDRVFENARQHGEVRGWLGTHPKFVQGWVDENLVRSAQFKRDLAAGRVGPLVTEKWWGDAAQ